MSSEQPSPSPKQSRSHLSNYTPTDHASLDLSTLPIDILFLILSYLCAPYSATKTTGLGLYDPNKEDHSPTIHPFENLAASCQTLYNAVEGFSHYLLHSVRTVIPFEVPPTLESLTKDAKLFKIRRKGKCFRMLWLKWARKCCAFCGKKSVRRCIFNSHLLCCRKCDEEQWPGKMTMTAARTDYHLSKLDLYLPNPVFCAGDSPIFRRFREQTKNHSSYEDHPIMMEGMPRVRYALSVSVGVTTTFFLKAEIERLAEWLHGDDDERTRKARSSHRKTLETRINWRYKDGWKGRWEGEWDEYQFEKDRRTHYSARDTKKRFLLREQ